MLNWFQALMPKEARFFDLFVQHAKLVVAGAEALRELLKGGDSIEQNCKVIFDREAEADEVTRAVLTAVRRTFITPFDRSDIQGLISKLDDSIDQMNKTAKTVTLFEIKQFEPQMQEMGDCIVEGSKLVLEAMPLLAKIGSNAETLHVLTEKIIRIEERADQIYDRGRKALYLASLKGDPQATMKFIIQANLYDHLEKVVDRIEDVSNEINALVTDHL
jgi:predicted phosphate transport protein (TIGR00153 family)